MPGTSLQYVLWAIAVVVFVSGLAYWVTRYVAGRMPLGASRPLQAGEKGAPFQILAQMALGKDQRLLMVRVCGRYFLLSAGQAGIALLAEFSSGEAEDWFSAPLESSPAPSFKDLLMTHWRKRR